MGSSTQLKLILTLGEHMALRVGQSAPDFSLKSHLGQTIRLSDYRDRCNVVLAFFPLAWTPI
jgi:peroxiredoxin